LTWIKNLEEADDSPGEITGDIDVPETLKAQNNVVIELPKMVTCLLMFYQELGNL
jgi:hypothetical protein